MEPVKINSLEFENVKRIRAVQIQPTKDGLTVIGGRNGQGKTSVLDAIAWALGGKKYQPDNPNRDGGATPAKLHVELSNGIVVERRGKNGTLYVTDSTGMRGTQKLLDEFLSALALDLPKFLNGTDKQRTDALLQTLGIDQELARIDGQIRATYTERTGIGSQAKRLRAHADELPYHEGIPEEPVSVGELVQQQQEILARNGENQRKREKVSQLEWEAQCTNQDINRVEEQIRELQTQQADLMHKRNELLRSLETAQKTAEQLVDESTKEIEESIAGIESLNAKVRDNQRKAEADWEAKEWEQSYADYTATIERLRAERVSLLDGAPLPLDGLTIDSDGQMTYKGQTWGDMSGSEQLRVATAIVRATKPDCGFVLLDKLEQMDSQTLTEFGEWAKSEGLQVIGTRVSVGDECTVVIEDGKVEGQEMPEPMAPDPKGTAFTWDGKGSLF